MKLKILMIASIIVLLCVAALAETKSDYDHSYEFANLKTWDFKVQTRMPTDPIGANTIWNQDLQRALTDRLTADGYQKVGDGEASFLVAYYMGAKQRYDTRYINYGFPGGWGGWGRWGRWGGWGGWGGGAGGGTTAGGGGATEASLGGWVSLGRGGMRTISMPESEASCRNGCAARLSPSRSPRAKAQAAGGPQVERTRTPARAQATARVAPGALGRLCSQRAAFIALCC